MSSVKLLIPFYTTYGTNHAMAEHAAEIAREAGAEVRLRRFAETAPDEVVNGQDAWKAQLEKMQDIPVITTDDMEWADAYLLSAPTRYGSVPSQVQAFIDTLGPLWQKGALADKVASAMTSTSTAHGGRESTLLGLYVTFMHWGAVIVAPGYTNEVMFELGTPYGASANAGEVTETVKQVVAHQTRRVIDMAGRISG